MSYEDSISPEVYELEREAIFRRSWLNVGRVEQLPRKGSYFTKELARREHVGGRSCATSTARCARSTTSAATAGTSWCGPTSRARSRAATAASSCASTTAGSTTSTARCTFVQQENEFFDLDKADYGLVPVHCDVWEGFIFVNLAAEPSQTAHRVPRADDHGARGLPVRQADRALLLPRRPSAATGSSSWTRSRSSTTHRFCTRSSRRSSALPEVQAAASKALHYEIDGPHRMVTSTGGQGWRMPPEMLKPMESADAQRLVRSVGRARPRLRPVARGRQPRGQPSRGASTRSRSGRTS